MYVETYQPDFNLFYICSTDSYNSRFIAKISCKMKVNVLWKLNGVALAVLLLMTKIINSIIRDDLDN